MERNDIGCFEKRLEITKFHPALEIVLNLRGQIRIVRKDAHVEGLMAHPGKLRTDLSQPYQSQGLTGQIPGKILITDSEIILTHFIDRAVEAVS